MRPEVMCARSLSFFIAIALLAGAASAGSAEAPELADGSGDCALPYGNEYLDVVAAWIGAEDEESFDVHLQLARWQEAVAEGSGYAVQFTHQDVTWGIVAVYSTVVGEGWEFLTGQASAELVEGLDDASGSFDPASATIVVTFPKSLFPHTDASDTSLRGFTAMTADLRPAYPFFAGEEAGLDPNGRWIVCDEATGAGEYTFTAGGHSMAHGTSAQTNATGEAAETPASDETPAAQMDDAALTPQSTENDTPLGPLALVAIAAAAGLAARRRR